MTVTPIKRALLSVSDKTGLVEFAQGLSDLGVELIASGGTSAALTAAHIPHHPVEHLTGMPEMMEGRVKTLHPKIHGGILGRRDQHAAEAEKHSLAWIDLVVVNLYPFSEKIKDIGLSWSEVVEQIDVGGPAMIRAAAKNFAWVGVVTDPADYTAVLQACRDQHGLSLSLREQLAASAFALTAAYDANIQAYFAARLAQPSTQSIAQETARALALMPQGDLRYGENPHQRAIAYRFPYQADGILNATQHQGKPLSYNNIVDAEAALAAVRDFKQPACVIVKHANPCGAAVADTALQAFEKALAADAKSAFGGIVALNQACDKTLAEKIASIFMEVIIAPAYTEEALAVFSAKPNLRCLSLSLSAQSQWEMKGITGGVLMQAVDSDAINAEDLQWMTPHALTTDEVHHLLFAWQVVKHVKSNAIVLAAEQTTVGIGAGQVSRVDAVEIALKKAGEKTKGAVLASDAFFPFRDAIDLLAGKGIKAIIQPGGSVRDAEVIDACLSYGIALAFTGKRCFRH